MRHVEQESVLSVQWRKSTRSMQGSQCVEMARTGEWAGVRDSKNPGGPALVFAADTVDRLLGSLRAGGFDPR